MPEAPCSSSGEQRSSSGSVQHLTQARPDLTRLAGHGLEQVIPPAERTKHLGREAARRERRLNVDDEVAGDASGEDVAPLERCRIGGLCEATQRAQRHARLVELLLPLNDRERRRAPRRRRGERRHVGDLHGPPEGRRGHVGARGAADAARPRETEVTPTAPVASHAVQGPSDVPSAHAVVVPRAPSSREAFTCR